MSNLLIVALTVLCVILLLFVVGRLPERFVGEAHQWFNVLNSPLGFVAVVITLAAAYFGFIDWRVQAIVKDPGFVAEVARRARPAIVFDADRRLLADAGAYKFLEGVPEVVLNIKDETARSELHTFTKIIVRPKVPLTSAPVLEVLDSGEVSVTAVQIAGTAWEIRVRNRALLIQASPQPTNLAPYRYRLEIIPPLEDR